MQHKTVEDLCAAAQAQHLECFGVLHSEPKDGIGEGTIVLFGPSEPGFWDHFTASDEYLDSDPDPMDRWSIRIISELTDQHGGTALFPFGTPARPFIGWALRSGQAFVSPASILVHAKVGMFVSYRGAVLLPGLHPLPAPSPNPCETCADKPCLTACPPRALTSDGYDLPACHSFLDSADGAPCMTKGCAVRRSCPLARNYPRSEAQSEFHMKVFHPWP